MNKEYSILLLCCLLIGNTLSAQEEVRTFIFGHSLIHHEFQVNTTPSQETSVPHWFHFLAEEANHTYAVSGQYGFLPQHANLPPIAQWGFDFVTGAWDSDNEPFAAADFTNILITPGNFIQWQPATELYFNDTLSPLDATNSIIEWCNAQEDELTFYIYENWPDMAPYLANDFPPNTTEWADYNAYLNGDFHDWFLAYHDSLINAHPNSCIRMIPVGPVISSLLATAPFNEIAIDVLYEDDAPHGRPTIYFLASLITYMAMFEEVAPLSYQPTAFIDPIIQDNYAAAVDFIWAELQSFQDQSGNSRVFCSPISTSVDSPTIDAGFINVSPNPSQGLFTVSGLSGRAYQVEVYNTLGTAINTFSNSGNTTFFLDLSTLPAGPYLLKFVEPNGSQIIATRKIVKLD